VLLAVLVAFVLVFPVQIERSGNELIFFGALQQSRSGLPIWITLPAIFVVVAAVMMTVGEGVWPRTKAQGRRECLYFTIERHLGGSPCAARR